MPFSATEPTRFPSQNPLLTQGCCVLVWRHWPVLAAHSHDSSRTNGLGVGVEKCEPEVIHVQGAMEECSPGWPQAAATAARDYH
jgi:hypothetical protein